MRAERDLSKAEFDKACGRYGFRPEGFMGYYRISHGVAVSLLNAGPSRRAQLAYLIQQNYRIEKEMAAK